jgi:hypothetical protein
MRQFLERAKEAGARLIEADACAWPSWLAATATRAWLRAWKRSRNPHAGRLLDDLEEGVNRCCWCSTA